MKGFTTVRDIAGDPLSTSPRPLTWAYSKAPVSTPPAELSRKQVGMETGRGETCLQKLLPAI